MYDFHGKVLTRVQIVRTHESDILQLADLLMGAVSYANRDLSGNSGKVEMVKRMRERSGYTLTKTTLYGEKKFNVFRWTPAGNKR